MVVKKRPRKPPDRQGQAMLRFWLKDGTKIGSHLPGSLVRVKTCPVSDKKYVEVSVRIMDPSANLPPIPDNLLERVTAVERIFRGLRTEGLYRHKGVTLTVATRFLNITPKESQTTVASGMWFSSESLVVECQDICVTAPNLAILQDVYSQFRQDKLKPAENYEAAHLSEAELSDLEEEVDTSEIEERISLIEIE